MFVNAMEQVQACEALLRLGAKSEGEVEELRAQLSRGQAALVRMQEENNPVS